MRRRPLGYLLKARVLDLHDFLGALMRVVAGGTVIDLSMVAQQNTKSLVYQECSTTACSTSPLALDRSESTRFRPMVLLRRTLDGNRTGLRNQT